MRYSFVIINNGADEYLEGIFRSLGPQLTGDHEVLVVGWRSTDGPLLGSGLVPQARFVALDRGTSRGAMYDRGSGLATGDFVVFCHSDIVFDKDLLTRAYFNTS